MEKFTQVKSKVIPLAYANVDTDQIIPARYLKAVDKSSLAAGLFADWCFGPDGSPNPDFVLNQPHCQNAQILLALENFGCGSSREHAVWALKGRGIRVVVAPSFADIFNNNALKNGLLPVVLEHDQIQTLFSVVEDDPEVELEVNLGDQKVSLPDGKSFNFLVDGFARLCLLNGLDQLGYLMSHTAAIDAYEERIFVDSAAILTQN